MKNTNISELCQNDISYISGAECKCLGGKHKFNEYISDLIKCMEFCCATYGEADKFLFRSKNKDYSYEDNCSLARLHLSKLSFTITYKFPCDSSIQSSACYK